MEHARKRTISFGPKSEAGGKIVECSCGWKSAAVGNYDDYQNYTLNILYGDHLAEIRKALEECPPKGAEDNVEDEA